MKILAFNGSPRKKWNTATLLEHALEGAASKGAATDLVHLYDLNFKGCMSCCACKTKDGESYGRCAVKDELAPVLEKVEGAHAIILGSPIYYGSVSGEMRSFIERLVFPLINLPPIKVATRLQKQRVGAIEDAVANYGDILSNLTHPPTIQLDFPFRARVPQGSRIEDLR